MDKKVIVHLKSGKKLTYQSSDSDVWLHYLRDDEGAVRFGRFTVPKREIQYVEVS